MSRKSPTAKSPAPESRRPILAHEMPSSDVPKKDVSSADMSHAAAAPEALPATAAEYGGGVSHALEMGKNSFDVAVCLSACALDIYKNACCFAPALGGYFELSSRLLAACADLQTNYYGLLKPHAEALDASLWGETSCEPAEVLERSMDIAIGAMNAQVSFLSEVGDASASFDMLQRSFNPRQQPFW